MPRGKALSDAVNLYAIVLLLSLTSVVSSSNAEDLRAFYKGKVVSLVVGAAAGTGYDISARIVANHIGRYIPGNPSIIVQNMPSAGFLVAANWLYNSAPRDGATLGALSNTLPMQPLIASSEEEKSRYRFDALKYNWIGSIENDPAIGFCRKGAPVKAFEETSRTTSLVAGSTPQSLSVILPTVLNNLLGTKFNIVRGYQNVKAPLLAVERGEADCHFTLLGTVRATNPQWIGSETSPINILIVIGLEKPAAVHDAPLIFDYAKSDEQQSALKLLLAPLAMGRPYLAPPAVAPERVVALRRAFDETMRDSRFLEDMKKIGVQVSPMAGQAIAEMLGRIYGTPTQTVETLKKAMPRVDAK